MAEQAEAGDVGTRPGAAGEQAPGAVLVRLQHRAQRAFDPPALGLEPHVGGEQGAGAERLGEDQPVAGRHAALAHDPAALREAVDRKAQGELRPLAGMAADQRRIGPVQDLQRAGHHLGKILLDLGLDAIGHGGDGQRRLGLGAHGEDVAERMVGRDLAEDVGVVDKRSEEIDGVDHHLAGGHLDDGGVIGLVKPDQHVVALDRVEPAQRALQYAGADLGAAAAAAHGDIGDLLDHVGVGEAPGDPARLLFLHLRQLVEFAHEAPVDPVLPKPDPSALDRPVGARGDGVFLAGAYQAQILALGGEGSRFLAQEDAAQVSRQGRTLADGEDARLLAGMVDDASDVAGGEHVGMGNRAQGIGDADETGIVERQAGLRQPRRGARHGHPEDLIERDIGPALAMQSPGIDPRHPMPGMHVNTAFGEDAGELAAHPPIVGRQYFFRLGDQMILGIGAGPPGLRQHPAKTVLDTEQKLEPAGAGADDADPDRAFTTEHPLCHLMPVGDEAVDRLDRHRVLGGARHLIGVGNRSDVDRQQIICHRRAVPAQHPLVGGIEADRLVMEELGAGEAGQRPEVDMGVIEAVMSGDQARQHARIGRVGIPADQRQADAGDRPHAEALEHGDMAVAAAEQHQILEHRNIGLLHRLLVPARVIDG